MIIVKIFKDNAGKINKTSAVTFEACKRRLRLYFSGFDKVKKRISAGEMIDLPYVTFQRDRRVSQERRNVENERRKTDILK